MEKRDTFHRHMFNLINMRYENHLIVYILVAYNYHIYLPLEACLVRFSCNPEG